MENYPAIDSDSCTLCSKCVQVCPKEVLKIENKKVCYTDQECMLCSQCMAVCRDNAISFSDNDLIEPQFSSFPYLREYKDSSAINPSDFLNILRSRRSIRSYKLQLIPDNVLSDLVSCAVTAPSGSNCQDWEFTIVNGKEKVWDLALTIKDAVKKVNNIVKNPLVRYGSYLIPGNPLKKYYEHIDSVEWAIEEAEKGNDLLFHGAPALIIFHSSMDGSTPVEDAQYASYNTTLMAHALGLGTCYIGYGVEILNRMKKIKDLCQIPSGHRVHAVLSVGYPTIKYKNLALRKNYSINFL